MDSFRLRYLLLLSFMTSIWSESSVPVLPEVVVQEKNESVTLARELARVAGGTNYIQAEDFQQGRATTVADALRLQPGIIAQSRFGAEESRLSIRGSGIQRVFQGRGIRLMQDGVPVDTTDGSFDFQSLEPLATRQIAVRRGGSALETGSSTLGGSIDYQSFTGKTATRFQSRYEFGSFGYQRAQVSGGEVIGKNDYYLSLSHYSEAGERDHTAQNSNRFVANFGSGLTSELENRFFVTLIESKSEIAAPLRKSEAQKNPLQGGASTVQNHHRRDFQLVRIADRLRWEQEDQTLESLFYYSYRDLDQPIFQVIDKVSNDFGMHLSGEVRNLFDREGQRIYGGIHSSGGFTQDHRFSNVRGNRGDRLADAQLQTFNQEIYAFHEYEWIPGFKSTLGGQSAMSSRGYEDHWKIDGDDSMQQFYHSFSPRFGLRYEIHPQTDLFANYSRTFEPPSFPELTSSAAGPSRMQFLQDQTADTIEFGSRGEYQKASWEVVYYKSWIQNELLTTTISPSITRTRNAQFTEHQGLETAFAYRWKGKENLRDFEMTPKISYLWSHYTFQGDSLFGNNRIAGTPEHWIQSEIRLSYLEKIHLTPRFDFVPEGYYVDHANTLKTDPSAIFSIRIEHQPMSHFSWYVEGRNLLNTKWTATTSVTDNATLNSNREALFYPGGGIAFYSGVKFTW